MLKLEIEKKKKRKLKKEGSGENILNAIKRLKMKREE